MAKIVVENDQCVGCGLCWDMCPDTFESNKEGVTRIKNETLIDDIVKVAIDDCPVSAISIGA